MTGNIYVDGLNIPLTEDGSRTLHLSAEQLGYVLRQVKIQKGKDVAERQVFRLEDEGIDAYDLSDEDYFDIQDRVEGYMATESDEDEANAVDDFCNFCLARKGA